MPITTPTEREIRVYIAGPYTKGDVAVNVRNALASANKLTDAGLYPYVPHLTHFWHLTFPRPYADWLRIDMAWLRLCHALLRLSGESNGADAEEMEFRMLRRPVFHSEQDVIQWARTVVELPNVFAPSEAPALS